MKHIATIRFDERESGEECLVVVREARHATALSLSRRQHGDIEVILGPDELQALRDALERAANA